MNTVKPTMGVVAVVVLLAGCATGISRLPGEAPLERYQPYLGPPIQSFTAFRFDGWEMVSRNQLIVWTGINHAYLITVWDSCQNLNFAQRVGIPSIGSTVSRLDSVHVGRERCPIQEIRPVDIARYKADRAARARSNE
jgi:Family of unknown function (DUF6491)